MKKSGGFTLLEMVVAIGIFSVIAAISYASIDRFLDIRTTIKLRHDQLRLLQRTMGLMEMDMRFMLNRPVRDGFGDDEASLISFGSLALDEGELVRLTTSQPDPELPRRGGGLPTHRLDGAGRARHRAVRTGVWSGLGPGLVVHDGDHLFRDPIHVSVGPLQLEWRFRSIVVRLCRRPDVFPIDRENHVPHPK